jgi:hypothetical protein
MIRIKQVLIDQNVDVNGYRLTEVATPTVGTDGVNKTYVDGLVNGLSWKNPCRVASQVNINLASAPANIDGEAMVATDRVLVKSQTDPTENGIYDYNGAGSAMTRSLDADTGAELEAAATLVQEGSDADNAYVQTTDSVTIGVSNIVFVLFSSTGGVTAGDGLQKVGAVISIKEADDSVVADANGLRAARPTSDNKAMPANVTAGDDDPGAGPILHNPVGRVTVRVNGVDVRVGNGIKSGVDCYFSDPGDTVAKLFEDVTAGDIMRWIGSVAGYQLDNTDEVDYDYNTCESSSSSSAVGG